MRGLGEGETWHGRDMQDRNQTAECPKAALRSEPEPIAPMRSWLESGKRWGLPSFGIWL